MSLELALTESAVSWQDKVAKDPRARNLQGLRSTANHEPRIMQDIV